MAKKFDAKQIVGKYNELKTRSSGAGIYKMKTGDNVVRLVLFEDGKTGDEQLYSEAQVTFINKKSYVIPAGQNNSPVHIFCKWARMKNGDQEWIKKLYPRNRFYFNAVVDGELQLLELGSGTTKDILAIFANEDYGNIADLKTGRQITISKSGSGLETEYSVLPKPREDPIRRLSKEPVDLNAYIIGQTATEESLISALEATYNVSYDDVLEEIHVDVPDLGAGGESSPTSKATTPEADKLAELEDMSINEMKKLAKRSGLKYSATVKKPQLLKLLVQNVDNLKFDDLPF